MTTEAYQQLGGLRGALDRHAEQIYESFIPPERAVCRRVLLRLVVPGADSAVTRNRIALEDLSPAGLPESEMELPEAVVQKLVETRLLTVEVEAGSGLSTVEPAHEALLQNWSRLAGWIEEDRQYLTFRRRLSEASRDWSENKRQDSYLLREGRLVEAEAWVQRRAGELNRTEQEFLDESRSTVLYEQQRERKQIRRLRWLSVGLTTALFLALVAVGVAWINWQQSENRNRLRVATELAGRAQTIRANNPVQSLLLSAEAVVDTRLFPWPWPDFLPNSSVFG